jgi:hypothetical protein
MLLMATKCAGERTQTYKIVVIGLALIIVSGASRIAIDLIDIGVISQTGTLTSAILQAFISLWVITQVIILV